MSVAPRPASTANPPSPHARATHRIGCVSFLNAKPLIEGVGGDGETVKFDVPSRLLNDLERGEVDIALCPVIDLQRSRLPLQIVPVGGIGCDGPTLTVRIYSRVPLDQVTGVYADTDSHTSIALMRVLLAELHSIKPRIIEYNAREHVAAGRVVTDPQTMLLIGDKVVTSAPPVEQYPHQLDLGEAWHELTGLPFVFAVWMTRQGTDLGDLPASLDRARRANETRIEAIVDQHAARLGWPRELAIQYLGHWLKYAIGPRQLEAIRLFFAKAQRHGVIDELREVRVG
jgi:chorismate dehydratase